MRATLMVLAAATLLGGTAHAANADQAKTDAMAAATDAVSREAAVPGAKKVLQVCDDDAAAWRSFSRDLGLPDFVTAKQVRANGGKAWAGPKCITASELRKLTGGAQLGALTKTPGR